MSIRNPEILFLIGHFVCEKMQFKQLNKSSEGAQVVFGLLSGRRSVTSEEPLSKRAIWDLTEILLFLAIHKSIMAHCATFNCSNDQQANVSLFRFPINDKKTTFTLASCTKNVQTTTNRTHTDYWQRAFETLLESLRSRKFHSKHRATLILKSIGWSLKRLALKPDAVPSVFDFQVRSQ